MKRNKDFKPRSYKILLQTVQERTKNGNWTIFDGLCKGCGLCKIICPIGAIEFSNKNWGVYNTPGVLVDPKICKLCGLCEQICPDSAIKLELKSKK